MSTSNLYADLDAPETRKSKKGDSWEPIVSMNMKRTVSEPVRYRNNAQLPSPTAFQTRNSDPRNFQERKFSNDRRSHYPKPPPGLPPNSSNRRAPAHHTTHPYGPPPSSTRSEPFNGFRDAFQSRNTRDRGRSDPIHSDRQSPRKLHNRSSPRHHQPPMPEYLPDNNQPEEIRRRKVECKAMFDRMGISSRKSRNEPGGFPSPPDFPSQSSFPGHSPNFGRIRSEPLPGPGFHPDPNRNHRSPPHAASYQGRRIPRQPHHDRHDKGRPPIPKHALNEHEQKPSSPPRRRHDPLNEQNSPDRPAQRKRRMPPSRILSRNPRQGTRYPQVQNPAPPHQPDPPKMEPVQLPINSHKQEFLDAVENNQVVLVSGISGAGKSTQIPKWLLETDLVKNKKQIVCVQPRRIAAISVATRVCEELKEGIGERVGFKVRFEELTSGHTKLKFVTDGILVFEACSDILLKHYSCIILDEAHERSIFNDLLMGICSGILPRRPDFRLILMSATLDISQFAQYFKDVRPYTIHVKVRVHPIKHYYRDKPLKNRDKSETYIAEIFEIVKTIERQSKDGDILVFLPGAADITTCVTRCENRFKRNWEPIPLFAAISDAEQQRIYKPPSRGKRKIIFSTNIAETSITVPGIVYVIDTGLEKRGTYNPKSRTNNLIVDDITQTSASQRAGRAGRNRAGVVYCFYTAQEQKNFRDKPRANILNQQIDMICLLILHIGFASLDDFPWLERPSDSHLSHATDTLISLKAVNKKNGIIVVTTLGHQMSRFPLQPRLSKALVTAKDYHCVEWMSSLVAMLTCGGHGIFTRPRQFKKQADEMKRKLANPRGDQFTLCDLLETFRDNDESEDWCRENFLRYRVLSEAAKVREELIAIATQCGWIAEGVQEPLEPHVRLKCLVEAFPENVAHKVEETEKGWNKYRCLNGSFAFLHPASTLLLSKESKINDYVVYFEQYTTARDWISSCSRISNEMYEDAEKKYHYEKKKAQEETVGLPSTAL